ncbi:ATP-binding cassette domain-containing protein [soil metagenome]
MIEFHEVRKAYRGVGEALTGITCSIGRGEFVAVLGPSGAGKSTMLKLIAGIERASAGKLVVAGQDITRLRPAALPWLRRSLGLTFQDQKLLEHRTALDNVSLPLIFTGIGYRDARARARAALDKVGLLKKEGMTPSMLSGGEQQRVAIARAIVNRPAVLLADEPTANLDAESARRIVSIFKDFNRVGVTVMVATHAPDLLAGTASRMLRIEAGHLVDDQALPTAA